MRLYRLAGAASVAGIPEAMDDFVSVVAGTLSPVEFFDPENLTRLMGLAPAM